jgi:hypothetical protein
MEMTIAQYASHRKVSKPMVYEYLKEGAISQSCVTCKKPLKLDAELADACLASSTGAGKDVDDSTLLFQKIRLTKINADRKELELKRASGLLIETAFAQKMWSEVLRRFISRIESIPAKLPPMVIGLSMPEIKAVTEKLIYEARCELSSPDLVDAALQTVCEQMQAQVPAPPKKIKKK